MLQLCRAQHRTCVLSLCLCCCCSSCQQWRSPELQHSCLVSATKRWPQKRIALAALREFACPLSCVMWGPTASHTFVIFVLGFAQGSMYIITCFTRKDVCCNQHRASSRFAGMRGFGCARTSCCCLQWVPSVSTQGHTGAPGCCGKPTGTHMCPFLHACLLVVVTGGGGPDVCQCMASITACSATTSIHSCCGCRAWCISTPRQLVFN